MEEELNKSLLENKMMLRDAFGSAPDFYVKDLKIMGFPCCICMMEGLSSTQKLWEIMLEELSHLEYHPKTPDGLFDYILKETAIPMESRTVLCRNDIVAQLTAGASVILIDGVAKALVLSTQSFSYRSVQQAEGEGNIRGSKEGFTEPVRINISLVRRLIRSDRLRIETMTIGERTKTEVALMYHEDFVSKEILTKLKQRLCAIKLPFLFDTGYLSPFLHKYGFSFFQAVGYTERPDTASAKICEGKIVILANGSPFAMIVPYFFSENFQTMDDYAQKAYFSSLIRVFKYIAFFIAVMLPGLFVSAVNFTPELFPPQLLYKISAADQATPMPLFLETLFVIFLLEIVREAGLRLPKPIGHSVGLVAALIVGDAAVSAGIIGTPIIIVAAMTTICTFVVPSLYEPITVLRILYVLAGGLFGPIGVVAVTFIMILSICRMNPFGIAYVAPIVPFSQTLFRDGVLRQNWRILAKSDFSVEKLSNRKKEGEE